MLRKIGILLSLCLSYPTLAAIQLPHVLVDSAWLSKNKDKVVILDIRSEPATFTEIGHIPHARLVNKSRILSKRAVDGHKMKKLIPTQTEFEALMSHLGVKADDAIVVTYQGKDAADLAWATRLYWTLKYFGLDNIAVYNGGTSVWQAAGNALSKQAMPTLTATSFKAPAERHEILATTADVETAMQQENMALLDTRTLDFYLGTSKKPYVFGYGHIPHSKVLPYTLMTSFNAPSTMLDIETLKTSFAALDIDVQKPVVVYCNSGHLATSVWFALSEMMENKTAKLYDGSMHAWTKNRTLPLARMKME